MKNGQTFFKKNMQGEQMLRVTFIHHSAFVVETDTKQMVFDYFPAGTYNDVVFHGKEPVFSAEKPVYVFASHSHRDHFSLEVLKWGEKRPDVRYIFSKDIRLGKNYLARNGFDPAIRERIKFIGAMADYETGDLKVHTLLSNDAGVAFVVETDGLRIYHAGDLSVWNVGENGQEVYRDIYTGGYKKQIRHLENKHIDIGFVVLDPRMGAGAYAGIDYFAETVDCDLIFPMHCWEDYSIIEKCKRRPQMARFKNKIVDIDRDNIIYDID